MLCLTALVIILPAAPLPPATDAERFPDYETAQRGAMQWHATLDAQRYLRPHRAEEGLAALAEASRRLELWQAVATMQYLRDSGEECDAWSGETVRESLAWLRETLGPQDYARGQLPSPVP